jgi:hypothetical protein
MLFNQSALEFYAVAFSHVGCFAKCDLQRLCGRRYSVLATADRSRRSFRTVASCLRADGPRKRSVSSISRKIMSRTPKPAPVCRYPRTDSRPHPSCPLRKTHKPETPITPFRPTASSTTTGHAIRAINSLSEDFNRVTYGQHRADREYDPTGDLFCMFPILATLLSTGCSNWPTQPTPNPCGRRGWPHFILPSRNLSLFH